MTAAPVAYASSLARRGKTAQRIRDVTDSRIGWIGTGIMGEPMARNLLRAGYQLHVHSRTRSKAQQLLADGASWEETPQELVKTLERLAVLGQMSRASNGTDAFAPQKNIRPRTRFRRHVAGCVLSPPQMSKVPRLA